MIAHDRQSDPQPARGRRGRTARHRRKTRLWPMMNRHLSLCIESSPDIPQVARLRAELSPKSELRRTKHSGVIAALGGRDQPNWHGEEPVTGYPHSRSGVPAAATSLPSRSGYRLG